MHLDSQLRAGVLRESPSDLCLWYTKTTGRPEAGVAASAGTGDGAGEGLGAKWHEAQYEVLAGDHHADRRLT